MLFISRFVFIRSPGARGTFALSVIRITGYVAGKGSKWRLKNFIRRRKFYGERAWNDDQQRASSRITLVSNADQLQVFSGVYAIVTLFLCYSKTYLGVYLIVILFLRYPKIYSGLSCRSSVIYISIPVSTSLSSLLLSLSSSQDLFRRLQIFYESTGTCGDGVIDVTARSIPCDVCCLLSVPVLPPVIEHPTKLCSRHTTNYRRSSMPPRARMLAGILQASFQSCFTVVACGKGAAISNAEETDVSSPVLSA